MTGKGGARRMWYVVSIMIFNPKRDPKNGPRTYDLCIIGSGPAGLTIANELKDAGITLCVLESGGDKKSSSADKLRRVVCTGVIVKEQSRERIFGGASTVWSGLSSLLDTVDFEQRSFVKMPGWPISRASLHEYYTRAAEQYGFPSPGQLDARYLAPLRVRSEWRPTWDSLDEKVFLASSPVKNFGTDLKKIFEKDDCDLFLDATVMKLEAAPGGSHAVSALVRSSDGSRFRLEAKRFVAATGGIENARLLLNSNDAHPSGLGNAHGQVGRYLMNHPKNYYGVIVLNKPVKELPYYFGHTKEGLAGYAGLRLKERAQKEKGLLNSYVRFEPLYPWSDSPGIEAFVTLVRGAKPLMNAWLKSKKASVVPLRDYSETGERSETQHELTSLTDWLKLFGPVLFHIVPVCRYVWSRLIEKGAPPVTRIRLRNFMEMEPRAENRVTLGSTKDAYGEPLPHVHHECSELDKRSLIELHRVLGREVAALGFGRLESNLADEQRWPIDHDASHHMGTTRMGSDPKSSVVDLNCKVHGVDNVYMAGASVFPTSGCANPTLTIVALAIRLAGHLKSRSRDIGSR